MSSQIRPLHKVEISRDFAAPARPVVYRVPLSSFLVVAFVGFDSNVTIVTSHPSVFDGALVIDCDVIHHRHHHVVDRHYVPMKGSVYAASYYYTFATLNVIDVSMIVIDRYCRMSDVDVVVSSCHFANVICSCYDAASSQASDVDSPFVSLTSCQSFSLIFSISCYCVQQSNGRHDDPQLSLAPCWWWCHDRCYWCYYRLIRCYYYDYYGYYSNSIFFCVSPLRILC